MAGKTLRRKLFLIVGFVLLVGVVTFAIARVGGPFLAPLAPLVGVMVVARLLQDKEIGADLVRVGRGYMGEASVGRALAALPEGWRVFHDVNLGGENVDHVVVSSRGVFTIEVKNYSGVVRATPFGLYTHGKRNDGVVKQAWRQARKLAELLRVEVQPILVFTNGLAEGGLVGRLQVMRVGTLVPYLLALTERRLDYEDARRLFGELEALTR